MTASRGLKASAASAPVAAAAFALGKSDRNNPHMTRSLIGHSLDVAYSAAAMLQQGVSRKRLETLAGRQLTDVQIHRLLVIIGLHDFGKANLWFQNRLRGLKPEASHLAEALAAVALPEVLAVLDPVFDWCDDPHEMLCAVIGHHGSPVARDKVTAVQANSSEQWRATPSYDPVAGLKTVVAALHQAFPQARDAAEPFPVSPPFWHAVAGLIQTADWMGSNTHYHPLNGPETRPDAAQRLLDVTCWSGSRSTFGGDVLAGRSPNMLQKTLLTIPLDPLVIAEAPTGEGKTEGAMCWFTRLKEAGLVDGMYFAVPTRSAASKLYQRISTNLETVYPDLEGRSALAVPGELGDDMRDLELGPLWSLGGIKQVMGAPIVVGTVDQTMLTVMRNAHAWLRSWCLLRHLLVIDEAHASDAYMSEIVAELVRHHRAAGGYVLLMSATLGEEMAHRLTGRPRLVNDAAISKPYPLVTPSRGAPVAFPARSDKTVNIAILAHASCLHAAQDHATGGGTVLWVRSTVADALADYDRLTETGLPVMLHHSRYAPCDRKYLDQQVLSVIGTKGNRRPMIIVATQTCEQSLDIDADMLVTDACPADVMLQRTGRVGRHRLSYIPEVMVIDPLSDGGEWERYIVSGSDKRSSRGFDGQGWGWVYPLLPVYATFAWLQGRRQVTVPANSRAWVEGATHPDMLWDVAQSRGPLWEGVWQADYGRNSARRKEAHRGLIEFDRSYELAVVDDRIPTRLGKGNVDFKDVTIDSAFGLGPVGVISIKLEWLLKAGLSAEAKIVVLPKLGEEAIFEVTDGTSSLVLSYGRRGLHKL